VSILVYVGRRADAVDHPLDRGIPGLVRCPRCSMLEPPQTATEVL